MVNNAFLIFSKNLFQKILKIFFIVFLVSTFSFLLNNNIVFAQSSTASQQLQQLLGNLQTYQADFTQTITDAQGNIIQQSKGKMALQHPGKFRWETTSPNQQLIIADGKNIWIYDKDLQQASSQKQTLSSNTPGILLSDSVDHLTSRFFITQANNDQFSLTPKGKKDLFQSVILMFKNNQLSQMQIHDNLGQITTINFSHIKINNTFPSSTFYFKAPQGVDVIDTQNT